MKFDVVYNKAPRVTAKASHRTRLAIASARCAYREVEASGCPRWLRRLRHLPIMAIESRPWAERRQQRSSYGPASIGSNARHQPAATGHGLSSTMPPKAHPEGGASYATNMHARRLMQRQRSG